MKKLILLCLFIATAFVAKAQSHISTGKYACQLVPKSLGAEKYTCPACAKIAEQKRLAKIAEDKRQYDASVESAKAAKAASIAAAKKLAEEREKKNKVTEVYITMPSSSSSGSSSSTDNSSASAAENSSTSTESAASSSDVTVYNNVFAAENARKYNEQKLITDASKLMGDFFDNWQANREKKWAREKQEEENHNERIDQDRGAYSSFVSNQTNSIFKNLSTYQSMMKAMLPKVLDSKSITWEDITGAPDYNNLFGKDIKSAGKKLKIAIPKDKAKGADGNLSADYLPKHFTQQDFYTVYGNQAFFYWVKTDFYEHSCAYIFDHNDILIGIKIKLHTSSHADKAFPSSLQEYVSVKDYYEDLMKNTKGGYFLADGKTLVTRDKVFILDFEFLTIYDLNFFNANTSFNLPGEFSQYFNSQYGNNYIGKLGIKFQGFRVDETKKAAKVRITEVDKNSAAEKAGLLPDDVILNINNVVIDFPFHLQWYFLAFPDEKNINLKIERAKKIENISFTL